MRIAILDCDYLCHRAYYSFQNLSYRDKETNLDMPTGVLFGFFKELISLNDQFYPDEFVFCFDCGPLKRLDIYPQYKKNRVEKDWDLKTQIETIRMNLKDLGFLNFVEQVGYEADDCIAQTCFECTDDKILIVSSDKDLYQLLYMPNVAIWEPIKKKMVTKKSFKNEYEISPNDWVIVKAVAGCSGDNIKGVPGVGEKTVIKYLNGELPKKSKLYKKIVSFMDSKEYTINLQLVSLPYKGIRPMNIKKNSRLNKDAWKTFCFRHGMKSLVREFN